MTKEKISVTGDAKGLNLEVDPTCEIASLRIAVVGAGNSVVIGARCVVNAYLYLAHGATIRLGEGTKMTGQLSIHAHEGSSVDIGKGCLFSNNVTIRPSDAHKIFDAASGARVNEPRPVLIGENVWVAEHVSILKGSVIPAGCVVGTRSVIAKRFDEENCVITGNPAQVIRRGIYWRP